MSRATVSDAVTDWPTGPEPQDTPGGLAAAARGKPA